MSWNDDNKWESDWWGNCANTYWEETKQQVYARKMGLVAESQAGKYPIYDLKGKSVLDIGGGPVSLLLKCVNVNGCVVDPCKYPEWIKQRYDIAGVGYYKIAGEDILTTGISDEIQSIGSYDEVWIYNTLQHTIDPQKIIENARKIGNIIRLFEWIDTDITDGHPHSLTEEKLNEWLGGEGKVEDLDESGCHGKAYYGLFKGEQYEKI